MVIEQVKNGAQVIKAMQAWPFLAFIFAAGIGWGVHQATLSALTLQAGENRGKIEAINQAMSEVNDRLARIETKLDSLSEKRT